MKSVGWIKTYLCAFQLTGNIHQLAKHGCVVGLRLQGEKERNMS